MVRSRNYQTDLIEALKDPLEAAEYLNAALEEGHAASLLLVLKDIAHSRNNTSTIAELTTTHDCRKRED